MGLLMVMMVMMMLGSPDRFVPPPFGSGFGSFLLFGVGSLVGMGFGSGEGGGSGCGGDCQRSH